MSNGGVTVREVFRSARAVGNKEHSDNNTTPAAAKLTAPDNGNLRRAALVIVLYYHGARVLPEIVREQEDAPAPARRGSASSSS